MDRFAWQIISIHDTYLFPRQRLRAFTFTTNTIRSTHIYLFNVLTFRRKANRCRCLETLASCQISEWTNQLPEFLWSNIRRRRLWCCLTWILTTVLWIRSVRVLPSSSGSTPLWVYLESRPNTTQACRHRRRTRDFPESEIYKSRRLLLISETKRSGGGLYKLM